MQKEAKQINTFSAKLNAVASKLDSAYRTQMISQQLKNATPALESALKNMNKMGISE